MGRIQTVYCIGSRAGPNQDGEPVHFPRTLQRGCIAKLFDFIVKMGLGSISRGGFLAGWREAHGNPREFNTRVAKVVSQVRGVRSKTISAKRATPKHIPEPVSCTTSTLRNAAKRG